MFQFNCLLSGLEEFIVPSYESDYSKKWYMFPHSSVISLKGNNISRNIMSLVPNRCLINGKSDLLGAHYLAFTSGTGKTDKRV